jgi:hypothetical protein
VRAAINKYYVDAGPRIARNTANSSLYKGLKWTANHRGPILVGANILAIGITAGAASPFEAAADAGTSSATETVGDEAAGTVYRVHGGDSPPLGRSWTPHDPATMDNPRAELGLPKENSGAFVSRATVLKTDGVSIRPALPVGDNPGGAEEWLFPNPAEQLRVDETYGIDPPY